MKNNEIEKWEFTNVEKKFFAFKRAWSMNARDLILSFRNNTRLKYVDPSFFATI